jgi:hypothetical protein
VKGLLAGQGLQAIALIRDFLPVGCLLSEASHPAGGGTVRRSKGSGRLNFLPGYLQMKTGLEFVENSLVTSNTKIQDTGKNKLDP